MKAKKMPQMEGKKSLKSSKRAAFNPTFNIETTGHFQ
jgi:hypothetical protein